MNTSGLRTEIEHITNAHRTTPNALPPLRSSVDAVDALLVGYFLSRVGIILDGRYNSTQGKLLHTH